MLIYATNLPQAYMYGFLNSKRIVIYDTLIQQVYTALYCVDSFDLIENITHIGVNIHVFTVIFLLLILTLFYAVQK